MIAIIIVAIINNYVHVLTKTIYKTIFQFLRETILIPVKNIRFLSHKNCGDIIIVLVVKCFTKQLFIH